MESRQVCCCGARIWCLVIGYLTLIFSSLQIVLCLFELLEISNGHERLQNFFSSIYWKEGLRDSARRDYMEMIVFQSAIVSTVLSIYSFVHGAILCVGVHSRKRVYLTVWLVMEIPLLLFSGILFFLAMVAGVLVAITTAPVYLLLLLPLSAFLGFLLVFPLWVVKVHWDELQNTLHNLCFQNSKFNPDLYLE